MGRDLTNLFISESFQYLIQQSGSEFQNGLGTKVTGTIDITSQYANIALAANTAAVAISSSFSTTASYALNAGSIVPATGSFIITASALNDTITYTKGDGSTFNTVISSVSQSISSSYAISASYAENAATALTASFATNFTASNILITGLATVASASITNLTVIYETASIIYSSGSNQFGDASNDVQTLYGTVDIKTGPLLVTGSMNISGSINMVNGADLVTHHVKAPATNGVEIQNNTGGVVGLFGAGGSLGTTFYGQVNGTTFSGSAFSGSLQGTASYATNALSASYAINATSASYVNNLNQQVIITGSLRGNVTALSISSQTASLDCSLNNFYTLQLVSGSNTFINPSNILPGQTINLLVSTTGSGTVSFPTTVKQVSGSLYVPTATTSKDIVTFISLDSTNLYLANVKNLI